MAIFVIYSAFPCEGEGMSYRQFDSQEEAVDFIAKSSKVPSDFLVIDGVELFPAIVKNVIHMSFFNDEKSANDAEADLEIQLARRPV